MTRTLRRRAVLAGISLGLLAGAATFAGHLATTRHRRAERDAALGEMSSGHYDRAERRLSRLAERWTDGGEVCLLLGECRIRIGRREGALAAWEKVDPAEPAFGRAARLRATAMIQAGRYAPAESVLVRALSRPAPSGADYGLERELIELYRLEGRFHDVRRALRASWCRSTDALGTLRELWMLDHAAIPAETWLRRLEGADRDDDRAWLGRANHDILVGRLASASEWLERCLGRRPDDPAVWRARLDLAVASDDAGAFLLAASHLPAGQFEAIEVQGLRAWLAARNGDAEGERRALQEVVGEEPGNAHALERLAALATRDGRPRDAEDLRRRKAEVDRIQHRVHNLFLDGTPAPSLAAGLAKDSAALGRAFDAAAWAFLADAMKPAPRTADPRRRGPTGRSSVVRDLKEKAAAISSPYRTLPDGGTSGRPALGDLLADLGVERKPAAPGVPGIGPAAGGPDAAVPRFVDDAASAGLAFTFDNGRTPQRMLPETLSGGVGLVDYDGDGWLDVYCVQGGEVVPGAAEARPGKALGDRLFRNLGDGTFRDASEASGIASLARGRGYGQGVAVGDYDNDGHADLFITRLQSYNLFRNRGDGTFEDVTGRAGLSGPRDDPTSAAFADLDNDGDLDLYVCHYMRWDPKDPGLCRNGQGEPIYCEPRRVEPAADRVFRNDGGRFADVTEAAGFADPDGRGLGVVAADLDGDGLVDLYVANDGTANYLFRNLGGFRFEEVGERAGVAGNASGGYQAGMGVACGDLDGDGRPELLVTNFYGEGTTLYRNLGGGMFADQSEASGLWLATRYLLGFGIAIADANNDGRPEIVAANGHVNGPAPSYRYPMPCRLYEALVDGRIADISDRAGDPWKRPRVGRGLAAGDLDNDGLCDALVVAQDGPMAYFHNRTSAAGRSLTLALEGTVSNRDGVGATVVVVAGGRRVAQRVGGGSYMSANDPRLHFGLGRRDRAERVEVRWPSGKVDAWSSLPAGAGYRLREGDPTPRPLAGFGKPRRP
ncbi:FG-GAP repeat protein [Aquisphaera giovannonii]|uniref:FG-GAP repeat protein n=1 Tax=Aquisphaera giovannonii TaxID=406548 RepID=A0A5B9WG71_9BACT|nr:FG-GAP-like repeat-containing protein [Aquisphaera giovannonii]QEH38840.1 FG-GAP repeat protein [Aquisphaera giovannonii]